jgi:hypothetical protein
MQLRPNRIVTALLLSASLMGAIETAGQVSPPAKSSPATDQRTWMAGTYRSAVTANEESARNAAIEKAVGGMSVFIRSAARSRISATTQILAGYSISFESGKIVVRPQGRPEMISGDQGEPADYVYNGKRSKLTQKFVDGRVVQVFVSEDGTRQNEFTLSKDGQTLALKATLTSPRLSTPVVYELSYKRAYE